MRYLIPVLFLILAGCKTEKKAENTTTQSPSEMWNDYIAVHSEYTAEQIPDVDYFHNNEEDANRLAKLVLNGKKRATSSLFMLYERYDVELPVIGKKQIVTDFKGNAQTIIEVTSLDIIPFHQISAEYAAIDMGTTSEPLKKWKKAHWDFFESFLKESGEKPSEEMLIVCERFKTIWPLQ